MDGVEGSFKAAADSMAGKLRGPIDKGVREHAADALYIAAEHVLGEALDIVPHEYGDLQASGRASSDPDTLSAVVSFDTPYAVVQHEDMTLNHDAGRSAKYLEIPLNGSRDAVRQILAQYLGPLFKGR